jgi:hypothetical protein
MNTNPLVESLPSDTKALELASSISSFGIGFSLVSGLTQLPEFMRLVHDLEFWWRLFVIVGCIQWLTIVFNQNTLMLRAISSWVAGAFWIWVGTSFLSSYSDMSGILALVVGIGNLYAYSINVLVGCIRKRTYGTP